MPRPAVDGECLLFPFAIQQVAFFAQIIHRNGGFFVVYIIKIKKNAEKAGYFEEKMLYLRVFKRNKINHNKF